MDRPAHRRDLVRIALAVCNYAPYRAGITNVAERHAAHLRGAGHEVVVICPAHDGEPGTTEVSGVPVRRLRQVVRHGNSALVPGIGRHLKGIDALYLHYPFYGGAEIAAATALARDVPYVVFFHMDVVRSGIEGKVLWLYERTIAPAILRRAQRVFVSSLDYARHASIGRYGLDNLEEFPYAIDTKRYRPDKVDDDDRRRLGIEPGRSVVLFVGAMDRGHKFKGVPELIEAFAGSGIDQSAQLVLVGEGDLRPSFERRARERVGMSAARFLGRVSEDDLLLLYRAADVTVLPSTTAEEAFGVVLIESMACGTPVIASSLPGVRSIVGDSAGVLVQPRDVLALASALRASLDVHEQATARRNAARRWVLERFSHERESAQIERAFSALARPARSVTPPSGFRRRR